MTDGRRQMADGGRQVTPSWAVSTGRVDSRIRGSPAGPHLDHPLRGRKMVEMVEMAEIGDRIAWICYMLGLCTVPTLTTP